jgi:uncharacterized membrane protein YkvA (DUF1232 family)
MQEIFKVHATEADLAKVIRKFEKKFKDSLSRIDFATDALAFYYYVTDRNVPLIEKSPAILGLLYFINPWDIMPDLTPVVGFLDDAGVIAALVKYYSTKIDPYREKAKTAMEWDYIDVEYKVLD